MVLTVITTALAIVAIADMVQMRRQIIASRQRTAEAVAQGIGHASELALAVRDERELGRLVDVFLGDSQIVFIAIYDQHGKILAHGDTNPAAWEAHQKGTNGGDDFLVGTRDIVLSAAGFDPSADLSGDPASAPDQRSAKQTQLGRAVVGLSMEPVRLAQQQQTRFTAVSTLIAVGFSVLAVIFAVRMWTRRLDRLVVASESISRGDLGSAICDRRNDEIGRLANAYDRMREAVRQRDQELRNFNDTLQQQVHERTRSLEDALHAAEAADRAKSRFLATMSHEIRTPLNGVVGMIDLLRGTTLDQHQQRFAQIARSSADALLNVINDILDFSKIEAGRMELESVEFDLPTVVEDLVEASAIASGKKNLELGCYIHPSVPDKVIGDPGRLRQILTNLTNNAVKFTEAGQVVIRASLHQEAAGHVTVKFTVTDTGIGIPADRVDRLFHSFTQVDASTTRKYGGTGLGLAISKLLTEMMGGSIGVESQVGKGSTFWFTVRLQRAAQREKPTTPDRLTAQMRNLRVLIVDDNAVNREILEQELTAWKLQTCSAADGPAALRILDQAAAEGKPFGLAILDWHMPEMDGTVLARNIRAADWGRSLPLVMLTSVEDRPNSSELVTLGFAAYLVKPVRQSRLFNTITEAISLAPAAAPQAITHDEPLLPAPQVPAKPAHVLLAEDNDINQMVANEILSKAGHTCDIVDNGRKAFDAAFEKHYDVVLMDCQMPEMDGFEATRAIRQREAESAAAGTPRHLPIIALTANAIKGDREVCLAAGMDDYVAKPIDPAQLIQAIAKAMAARPALPSQFAQAAPSPLPAQPAVSAPVQSVEESTPIDTLAFVSRCLGNTDLALDLLERFQDQLVKNIDDLRQSLAEGNAQLFVRLAHTLKGSAANVGANGVRQAAFDLERLGREGNLAPAKAMLQEVQAEIDRCRAFIPEARQAIAQLVP
jgi:signal transduction histidine kinase/CheY-like chemotaxis protein/HPt (histidine-containing phosphotransfer) domain-containing protein